MPDRRAKPAESFLGTVRSWFRRHRPHERLLFGGTYGLVLASALIAALENPGEHPDPGADLLWVLLTAGATAAAHGYAQVIAHRAARGRGAADVPDAADAADAAATGGAGDAGDAGAAAVRALRTVLSEWPLVAAVLPTAVLLSIAVAGWWKESDAVQAALWFNTVALFGWGTWAARIAGRGWAASCRSGGVDLMIGLLVVAANALIH
ncbi:hypothetical protein [Streptomyces winkii]|uniref:hypothetical protein n=1 Tax=Streptomyces winkii TaxID=3051178 RepID=UPI0028D20CEE|nr:hypothetical protein [Streptomyces sp. DSM 40971]